jgi:hypothetical protein
MERSPMLMDCQDYYRKNDHLAERNLEKEIKDFLELNEHEGTTYSNLWDTMIRGHMIRGKLIALSADKKKLERSYTTSLTAHLKSLEQKMQIHSRGVDSRK